MLYILPIALIAIVANKISDRWRKNCKEREECQGNRNNSGVFYVRQQTEVQGLGTIDELCSPRDYHLCKQWKEVYRNDSNSGLAN